ncbi:hypothetical protein RM697_09150 [Ichthyenterobacterium sp. W332]|uniref:Uncharacterized protein n=1 Tax=Microcosmobacter mediterraneus TaxID=3075607 RepID=A0ABU2YKX9_9FLAO|nr:hypothetical protein [Ichthyenterobacterium sp. W332]MDT0558814.1 hypothetical protein [Ichthyenterobacterium sp. W332]
MEQQLINLLMYTIPALVTGAIAYMFFKEHVQNENNRRNFLITKDLQKEGFPIRLQAYERMTLFLERIKPSKLLTRVSPTSSDKESYESLLIATIEQELEHNLSQQIYVSDQCWSIIMAAKNATIQLIRKGSMLEKTTTADKLREVILTEMMEKQSPSNAALSFIKQEISEFW